MTKNPLNERQQRAVTSPTSQILVLAGPGSGKTRVLTHRIAHLVQGGMAPQRILAVTFTNKAAREMETRLEKMLGGKANGVWLGTFHATCARILRREAQPGNGLPFDTRFVIMDADDQLSIVRRLIKELNISDKLFRPNAVLSAISNAKNNLILPQDFGARSYRDEVILRVYERYQQSLQSSNALDFDDLLLWVVRLFAANPEVQNRYARQFEYVLVDEFQDTNRVQYELLRQLSSAYGNLFVVGDEDQSIYRWRGADYRNVLRFEQDYPRCEKILLEQNYRSTQTVLDAARGVIDQNRNRTRKHLSSARAEKGKQIVLFEAADDHEEAEYVVSTIQRALKEKLAEGADFAIMYRTNAQSRVLEEAFLSAGLPYRLVGAQRFYGRREIKDMIAYLRLVYNPSDDVSLGRAINVPARHIGEKTLEALQEAARGAGVSSGELLLELGSSEPEPAFSGLLPARTQAVLQPFARLLLEWHNQLNTASLPTLFDRILEDTHYQSWLDDGTDEGTDRWGNVLELRKLAYDYETRGLEAFLENLALVSDQDTLPEENNAATLLTLHAAKGLEFDRVFIIGMDEGLLPHSRSKDDEEEMAEERRLFYVGLTRAKNQIYLVRAERRTTYGSYEYSTPSQFLDDIPRSLLQQSGKVQPVRRVVNPAWDETMTWGRVSQAPASARTPQPAVQSRYKATMRVRHPSWGDGVILESRIEDGEETVDVHFESVGFKRLLASLAKLEILS